MSVYVNDLINSPDYYKFRDHLYDQPKIDEYTYTQIHSSPVQKLGISIDLELFNRQVKDLKDHFQQWGINPDKQDRYGIALTDPDVEYNTDPHPACWPLDIWCWHHPDDPLTDADFVIPNQYYYYFSSLEPLYEKFKDHICRLNITWWDKGGEFTTHRDVPEDNAVCFRTWISNETGTDHEMYFGGRDDPDNLELVSDKLAPGELYLLDTSCYHRGISNVDNSFTIIMSLLPSAQYMIKEMLDEHKV